MKVADSKVEFIRQLLGDVKYFVVDKEGGYGRGHPGISMVAPH